MSPRRHKVSPGTIEFKQDWQYGARIIITAENSPDKDGKPLFTTTIDMSKEFAVMALFEQARRALNWHRAQQEKRLKMLTDCLEGQ